MILSRETKTELVFKGGTCLYKFHGLNRFSEDLDFSGTKDIDKESFFERLLKGFEDFDVKGKLKSAREPFSTVLAILKLEGPLYNGNPRSRAKIQIDINQKSEVILPPIINTLYSGYRDILPFKVLCMDKSEIAAEKVRAIITRDKARDMYDLWFLLKKDTMPKLEIIEKKMEYYQKSFDEKTFISRLRDKEAEWDEDLVRLIFGPLPDFKTVIKEISEAIKS